MHTMYVAHAYIQYMNKQSFSMLTTHGRKQALFRART